MEKEHNHQTFADVFASLPNQRRDLLKQNDALLKQIIPMKVNR
jgi:hypothetical protein